MPHTPPRTTTFCLHLFSPAVFPLLLLRLVLRDCTAGPWDSVDARREIDKRWSSGVAGSDCRSGGDGGSSVTVAQRISCEEEQGQSEHKRQEEDRQPGATAGLAIAAAGGGVETVEAGALAGAVVVAAAVWLGAYFSMAPPLSLSSRGLSRALVSVAWVGAAVASGRILAEQR